jgi:uncharacterized membrane protein YedE/YeeE
MNALAPFLPAIVGGLLIGLSAALFAVLDGRIAGISGLFASAMRLSTGAPWSIAALFILGLPLGGFLVRSALPQTTITVTASLPLLIASGLLVGFGTRMGSGCTSGHGVCGMARLSGRSFVAVAVFVMTATATVYVARHIVGAPA